MKRIVSIISAAAVLFSFQSCEVEPTSLSGDSLPVKVTVAGHCRYVAKDKVEYAVKTVKVNNEGYFETEIGCPVGKSLSVKVQASFKGECYAKDSNKGTYSMVETIFFGTVTESLPAGDAGYFDLKLYPHAYLEQEDLVQP